MSWFNFNFPSFSYSFLSILFEGIPFVLLGSILSGIIDAFLPSQLMTKLLPRNRASAIWLSGLMGLIFPMCECGSVVVIRRFIKKGLPVSSAVTYMLAAPIVNPVVALSTFAAFRGQNPWLMASLRLLLGFFIAVLIGFLVRGIRLETLLRKSVLDDLPKFEPVPDEEQSEESCCCSGHCHAPQTPPHHHSHSSPTSHSSHSQEEAAPTFSSKLVHAARSATSDFIDVAAFLVVGAAIAATFNTSVNQSFILPLASNSFLATIAMMLLAFGLAICSTSDAFIAASFVTFPFTAKLAFLVFGAMFDIKLFFLYGMVFRRKCVITLAIGLFIGIALISSQLAFLN
jgi:uncharacterized membrane protein YraQ (UPF0718 family)